MFTMSEYQTINEHQYIFNSQDDPRDRQSALGWTWRPEGEPRPHPSNLLVSLVQGLDAK